MNWLDAILVIFLILSGFLGLKRGLVKTIVPVIGLIAGVVVAGRYYDALAHRVFSSHSTAAYVLAFAIIVLLFLVVAAILAIALQKALSLVLLGWLDRLAGGILGLLLGSLIAGAILALLLRYSLALPTIGDSSVASFLVDKFPLALSLLPGDFDPVREFFQ